MIVNWDKYVKNIIPIGLRKPRLIQLVTVLLSGITSRYSDLLDYMEKSRLYASCTWQVCWLEFMLRLELDNETISIQDGDGQPYNFIVLGITNNNKDKASAILSRFKLAGLSYLIIDGDIEASARWSNYYCQKELHRWRVKLNIIWEDTNVNPNSGFAGQIGLFDFNQNLVSYLTIQQTKQYSTEVYLDFDSNGYYLDFSELIVILDGVEYVKAIRWYILPSGAINYSQSTSLLQSGLELNIYIKKSSI